MTRSPLVAQHPGPIANRSPVGNAGWQFPLTTRLLSLMPMPLPVPHVPVPSTRFDQLIPLVPNCTRTATSRPLPAPRLPRPPDPAPTFDLRPADGLPLHTAGCCNDADRAGCRLTPSGRRLHSRRCSNGGPARSRCLPGRFWDGIFAHASDRGS